MLDAFSKAAAWDPIGLASVEPTSYSDRLKAELKVIRAGVRAVVEGAQGIPTTRADTAAELVACLREVMQEQRDELDAAQRELKNHQKTIVMLQEERRRYSAQHQLPVSSPPPQAPPPPPAAPPPPPSQPPVQSAAAASANEAPAAAVEAAAAAAAATVALAAPGAVQRRAGKRATPARRRGSRWRPR